MNQATVASFSLLNSGASTVVGPNSQHSNNSGISMPAVDKAISSPPLLSSYLNAGNDDSDLRGDNNRRSNHGRDGRRDGKNFDQRTQTPLLRSYKFFWKNKSFVNEKPTDKSCFFSLQHKSLRIVFHGYWI